MKEKDRLKKLLWSQPEKIEKLFPDQDWLAFRTPEELPVEQSAQMLEKIHRQVRPETRPVSRSVNRIYWPGIYAVAATLLLVFVSIVLWEAGEGRLIAPIPTAAPTKLVQLPPKWKIYYNAGTGIAQIVLPDSSFVRLFPKGTLRYLPAFTTASREVFLKGKAYFHVEKDEQRPFSVYAGGLKTTVLGTSFTINTEGHQHTTLIRLHTGKIQVEAERDEKSFRKKILHPGEELVFNQLTQKAIRPVEQKKEAVPTNYLQRDGDRLLIRNAALQQVLQALEEAYQVKISVKEINPQNITYTGDIHTKQETIESVLNNICLLNGLELQGDASVGFIMQPKIMHTP